MERIVNSRVKLKKDTQSNWQAENPVLLDGEIALAEIGSDIAMKVGDGVTAYNALEFIATTEGIEMSDVNGLQAALNSKADSSTAVTYDALQTALQNLNLGFVATEADM